MGRCPYPLGGDGCLSWWVGSWLPPLTSPSTGSWLSPTSAVGSGLEGEPPLSSTRLCPRSGTRSMPGSRRCSSSSLGAACLAPPPSSLLAVASVPRLSPSRAPWSQLFYAITPQYYVLPRMEPVCMQTHSYMHILNRQKKTSRDWFEPPCSVFLSFRSRLGLEDQA